MRTNLLQSTTSRRGAARLNVIWVILAVVVAILMAVFGFIAQGEAAKAKEGERLAKLEARAAVDERVQLRAEQTPVSKIFGFTDDPAAKRSDAAAAKLMLDQAKAAFPDTEGIETFEALIPRMTEAYQAKLAMIGTKDSRVSELTTQYNTEVSSRRSTVTEKDKTIEELQTALSDTTAQKDGEIARLASSNEQLQNQVRQLTDQVTAAADQQRDAERFADRTTRTLATERGRFNQENNLIRRRSEKPDGIVTAVESRFDLGVINLTAGDRLSEGTVFRIVSGRPNADASVAKGYAIVTDVGPEVSEVRLFDIVDPLGQPIVPGDKLYNPLYEPKAQRDAVLAGTITGIYNEEELRLLLDEIGINVQDQITNTTNYLITGGPVFMDEDGEPLEEPLPVEELPEYTEALNRGIVVIPMSDVTQYFRR